MHNLEALGEPQREAALDALTTTFGRAVVRGFEPIIGGVSGAHILRFDVGGSAYVLRLEPERVAVRDLERGYACMSAAAEVGAAPRVYFADPYRGVAIMDFVANVPLSQHPEGEVGLARDLGRLIARVQQGPLFPDCGDYGEMIAAMLEQLGGSPDLGPVQLDACLAGLTRIREALAVRPLAAVSSHNDPNPRNLLFDGERLWLVDWELGFRNDPMVDVAIATSDLIQAPEAQALLLRMALDAAPDPAVLARLDLVRLLTRLFYGCVVLDSLGGRRFPKVARWKSVLTSAGFRRAIQAGRLTSGSPEVAYAFARMSFATFLRGIEGARFDETVAVVVG
jgi:hypothetical protein